MYKVNFRKSWSELGNNIILLLPDLINLIFYLTFGYIILNIAGLYDFFKDINLLMNSENVNDTLFFLQSNLSTIIISTVIFIIGAFLFNIAITATKFGMIRDVINKKRASFLVGLSYIKKYYGKIFSLKLWTLLIYLVVLIAAIILNIILRALGLDITSLIISLMFLIVLVIITFLSLMFRYPIMFTKNKNAKESINISYKFFKENKRYSLVILGIIVLIVLAVSMAFSILGLIPYIGEFIQSLSSLGTLVISIWANIFLFNSYLKR